MNVEEELKKTCRDWDRAMVTNNAAGIGSYMSDQWVSVGTDGNITNKASFLGMIATGDLEHTVMDSDEMIIKIHGDVAIVITKGTSAGNWKGETFSLYEWSKNVFIKEQGKWLCISTMLSPAEKDA